jgi:hypothetical protein
VVIRALFVYSCFIRALFVCYSCVIRVEYSPRTTGACIQLMERAASL